MRAMCHKSIAIVLITSSLWLRQHQLSGYQMPKYANKANIQLGPVWQQFMRVPKWYSLLVKRTPVWQHFLGCQLPLETIISAYLVCQTVGLTLPAGFFSLVFSGFPRLITVIDQELHRIIVLGKLLMRLGREISPTLGEGELKHNVVRRKVGHETLTYLKEGVWCGFFFFLPVFMVFCPSLIPFHPLQDSITIEMSDR